MKFKYIITGIIVIVPVVIVVGGAVLLLIKIKIATAIIGRTWGVTAVQW